MLAPGTLAVAVAGVVMVGIVAAWVLRPLWRGEVPLDPPDPRAVSLLQRRESALATVRDLDADFRDGRLGETDYAALRADAVASGAAALAALDTIAAEADGHTLDIAATIEAEVRAARSSPDPGGDEDTDPAVCQACGKVVGPADRFCASCGAPIDAPPEARS